MGATQEKAEYSTRCLMPLGQTTDSRPSTDIVPPSSTNSAQVHSSMDALSTRTSSASAHVKRRARTSGTRLERQILELRVPAWPVCDWRGDHKVRGVPSSTRTCKVGTLRQALHISRDASCSSSVDAYQRLFPSLAWLKAMTKASRHRLLPERHLSSTRAKRKDNIKNEL